MTLQPNLSSKLTLAQMREMYADSTEKPYLRGLVIGRKGVGKTHLLKTCVKPVLLDLFDPDGEQTLRDDFGKLPRWLIVRRYYDDDGADRYKKDFEILKRDVEFQKTIGTYAMDSVTQFGDSHIAWILKNFTGKDQRQAYNEFLNLMSYFAKSTANFQCHVLWMGHISRELDQTSGKVLYKTMISGKSSDKLPTMFSESYALECEPSGDTKFKCADGMYRWMVVRQNGMYDCSTRLGRLKDDGSTRFELKEPVDMKALLKKAGLGIEDLPY